MVYKSKKCALHMRDKRLVDLEELDLIVNKGDGTNDIVPRDRSWLERKGILPYDRLQKSNLAEAENRNIGSQGHMILSLERPNATGVEISNVDYEKILNMPFVDGQEGLRLMFEASFESEKTSPVGLPLSVAMCEVYSRLKILFPNKSPGWRKAETMLYFGRF